MLIDRSHKNQRGFSLTEVAIVIGIFGVVLGALWIAAGRAWDYTKREAVIESITTTVTGVRAFLTGQAGVPNVGYPTLTNQLLTVNAIPATLNRGTQCGGNQCADHPWGPTNNGVIDSSGTFRVCNWQIGSSTVCSSGVPGNISPFFGVALVGLQKTNCIALVETITGASGPAGLEEVNINGTNLTNVGKAVQPVTAEDATTYCTSANNGNGTVTFIYRLATPSL